MEPLCSLLYETQAFLHFDVRLLIGSWRTLHVFPASVHSVTWCIEDHAEVVVVDGGRVPLERLLLLSTLHDFFHVIKFSHRPVHVALLQLGRLSTQLGHVITGH